MPKCKIMECNKEAVGNFPCCSETHGTSLRMRIANIKNSFDADMDRSIKARELYDTDEAKYYMNLNN